MSASRPRVLVATLAIDYPAPARLPWELRQAGCDVALVAPAGSLAAYTPHVDRRAIAAGDATPAGWTDLLVREIDAFDPAIVLPGDDAMVRLILDLCASAPAERAVALLRASLGDVERAAASIDKTRMFEQARSLGIRVADGGIATDTGEAVALATRIGYPVIVRAAMGAGGKGTARCDNEPEVVEAVRKHLSRATALHAAARRFLVQRWIDGPVIVRASLAWNGDEVAGATRGRLATYPTMLGPGSAVVFAGIPGIADATRALLRGLDATGFCGTQFIVEPGTGAPLLLEINRRMVPATYGSRYAGVDQVAALAALLRGEPWDGPVDLPDGPGRGLALFPQEWYRDPDSAWLADLPCDAPWHDPALFRAMLRLPLDADPAALARRYREAAAERDARALTSPSAAPRRTPSP